MPGVPHGLVLTEPQPRAWMRQHKALRTGVITDWQDCVGGFSWMDMRVPHGFAGQGVIPVCFIYDSTHSHTSLLHKNGLIEVP